MSMLLPAKRCPPGLICIEKPVLLTVGGGGVGLFSLHGSLGVKDLARHELLESSALARPSGTATTCLTISSGPPAETTWSAATSKPRDTMMRGKASRTSTHSCLSCGTSSKTHLVRPDASTSQSP